MPKTYGFGPAAACRSNPRPWVIYDQTTRDVDDRIRSTGMNGDENNTGVQRPIDAALIQAAGDVDAAEVARLLAQGADANAADEDGRTALHEVCFAVEYEEDGPDAPRPDLEIIATLLAAGAEVDATDTDERTPMFNAVRGDGPNRAAMRALSAAGADADAADADGVTPLMTVFEGFFEPKPVALLLEMGADPLRENLMGRSAWDLAHDEVFSPGAGGVRELMKAAIAARGLQVPKPRQAAPSPGMVEAMGAELPNGPKTMNAEEWAFTMWSAALQLLSAWLLWRWGMELPALVWVAMTPVNVLLMMAGKWAIRDRFIAPAFWKRLGTFASTPLTFAGLLVLHWYQVHWVVWMFLAIYLVLVVGTLWLAVAARRAAGTVAELNR